MSGRGDAPTKRLKPEGSPPGLPTLSAVLIPSRYGGAAVPYGGGGGDAVSVKMSFEKEGRVSGRRHVMDSAGSTYEDCVPSSKAISPPWFMFRARRTSAVTSTVSHVLQSGGKPRR